MDRKKIYIAIIVVCVLGSAGLLYWNSQIGAGTVAVPQGFQPTGTNIDTPVGGITGNATAAASSSSSNVPTASKPTDYSAPTVFPQDLNLDLSVYDSSKLQNLTDYTPLSVSSDELGRDNPFKNY